MFKPPHDDYHDHHQDLSKYVAPYKSYKMLCNKSLGVITVVKCSRKCHFLDCYEIEFKIRPIMHTINFDLTNETVGNSVANNSISSNNSITVPVSCECVER